MPGLARVALAVAAGIAATWLMLGADTRTASSRISSIAREISGASPALVAAAGVLYSASLLVRAWRMRALAFRSSAPTGTILPVIVVHAGLGHMLPVRLSDVALVGLLKTSAGIPAGHGAAAVIMAKLLDLCSMGLLVFVAVAGGLGGAPVAVSLALLVLGAAGLALLPAALGALQKPVERLAGGGGRIEGFLSGLRDASGLWRHSRSRFLGAALLSMTAWALKLAMFALLARSVGLFDVPVWQAFVAGALTDLVMAVPVHGIFSLGTAEAGWAAGFALAGVTGERVIVAGFGVHLIWMAMAVLLMLVCLPFAGRRAGRIEGE